MPDDAVDNAATDAQPAEAPDGEQQARRSLRARLGGAAASASAAWRERAADLRPGSRDLWQAPTSLGAVVLLALGLIAWVRAAPEADFKGALASVRTMLDRHEYERARDLLNGPILNNLDDPAATPEVMAEMAALRADTLYLLQRSLGVDERVNHAAVVDEYEVARAGGVVLDDRRVYRLAETLLALGRDERALDEARTLSAASSSRRHDLLKRIIERGLGGDATPRQRERAERLLAELRHDPSISAETRYWTVVRQARVSIEGGYAEEAVRRLLPEVQRGESTLTAAAGELFLLLGAAYYEMGRIDDASRHLEHAEGVIPESDPNHARAQVLLGRVAALRGELEAARDRFSIVTSRFPRSGVGSAAWLGLGEVNADLGDPSSSVEAYEQAVLGLLMRRHDPAGLGIGVTVDDAGASLAQRYGQHTELGEHETALRYAHLEERLHRGRETPVAVLERLAGTHRRLADELLAEAPRRPDGEIDVRQTDPGTFERARLHYSRAGGYFQRLGKRLVITKPDLSAEAIWQAADAYDHAGDMEAARLHFGEYVDVRHGTPEQVRGLYRLGRINQAMGDYRAAIEIYRRILADHATSPEAYRSYLPLAQSSLLASGDRDHEEAERLLQRVIGGEIFEPTAPEFRAGLIELGQMYRRIGRYTEAIRRLTEALERYPDLGGSASFVFGLAEAFRMSAGEIGATLATEAMPQSERLALRQIREERLLAALDRYEQVRQMVRRKDPRRLTEFERVMLRNSQFYKGDCAFDLGELFAGHDDDRSRTFYLEAIEHYDAGAQNYGDDAASLVAMIQIVNCHAALGRWREVQTAHERARVRLAELPPDAWDDRDAPMDRRHWERWLEASVELERMAEGVQRN